MSGTIEIDFMVAVSNYVECPVKFTKLNKQIVGDKIPFLLVGYTENIYTEHEIYIPLSNSEMDDQKNYKATGKFRSKASKIRPDSKLIFQLYDYVTNDDDFPVTQRVSETAIYMRDMINKKQFPLIFKNKKYYIRLELSIGVLYISYDDEIFEDEDKQIYDTRKNSKKIDCEIANYSKRSEYNRKCLFTEFIKNTKNMAFSKSFEFYKYGYCFSYLDTKIGQTNEEFWDNILYRCIQSIWLESGRSFKLRDPKITDEKTFRHTMNIIFEQFTLKEKLNVMTDMFACISVNTPYTPDFVVNKNGEKIKDEDFFEIDMGYGDCDDLAKYIIVCVKYFKSIKFSNEILQFMRRILHYYIPFLALTSTACSASYNYTESSSNLSAHLSSPWILKSWLFAKSEKRKDEDDVIGKIITNPFVNKDISGEILENIDKIIQYEKDAGYLVDEIDGEKLPPFLILEGTGKFNSTADDNPLKEQYKKIDKIFSSNSLLFEALASKSYAPKDDKYAFYQNFHILVTEYFLWHPKYPTNIPSFTLTNHKSKQRREEEEDEEEETMFIDEKYDRNDMECGYNYGESYSNLVDGCEDTLFVCSVPIIPFKKGMEISDSIAINKINTQDLFLVSKTDEKIIFKPKYKGIDKKGNLIDIEAITPMLPLKTLLKLDKMLLDEINNTNNRNFQTLKESEYAMYSEYFNKNNNKKIVMYDVKVVDKCKYIEDIFNISKKEGNIVAAVRNDIAVNISNYRIFIKI